MSFNDHDVDEMAAKMEQSIRKNKSKLGKLVFFGIIGLICLWVLFNAVDTNNKGEYRIVQYPVTGKMVAKMDPGMYFQMWGDVQEWPKSETFYFTSDKEEGASRDQSIEVRFNDGSVANISGTCRVLLPTSPDQAIKLMTDLNFRSYSDLEHRFIMPIVRSALRTTANLMNSRQSYSEKRLDFKTMAWDQIQNGLYKTEEQVTWVEDPEKPGQKVRKTVKVIRKGENGMPLRDHNPLNGTGISLANFEVKKFEYDPKVKDQIAKQQDNYMAIATATAEAQRAEQEAKTAEAQGKRDVMKVKYEEMKEKERATVQAEKEAQVATINAQREVDVAQKTKERAEVEANQRLEVARLDKKAAAETKQKLILEGEGEAKKKQLIMQADGALEKKLEAYVKVQEAYAKAIQNYEGNWVPTTMLGGSGEAGNSNAAMELMQILSVKAAKDLALDTTVKK